MLTNGLKTYPKKVYMAKLKKKLSLKLGCAFKEV
jgi:hypothetical protein